MRGETVFLFFSAAAVVAFGQERVVFREALEGSGVDYVNVSGEADKRHILSTLGSGVGLIDYDDDGDLDLYFANGARLGPDGVEEVTRDRLYRNDGKWRFTDVTDEARLGDRGWGMGVAVADVDNDGLADLYVTRVGPNLLYRNLGDGTFTEVGGLVGVADASWGTSAAFVDADNDGDLDLYVANYVSVDLDAIPPPGREARCQWFGLDIMCGPKGLPGSADVFFLNQGDGTFTDATEDSGLYDATGAYALGVVTGDYDDDGDLDLYVANDSVPNFLYRNDGRGRFEETAFLSGVALSTDGLAQAGMGVDMGDLDGDGRLDLYVTNFSHETNNAFMNHGHGLFVDAAGQVNLDGATWFALGWGTRMVDFDNDGDLDIFVANGHVYPGVDDSNLKTRYHQRNQIFWNTGEGGFTESTFADGDAMARASGSRAAAFGDLDGDLDMDGVVIHIDAEPSLLDNELGAGNAILLRLVGRDSARDAVGARVIVSSFQGVQVREVHASGSFLSSNDPRVHVGLGRAREARVRVRWPSGREEDLGKIIGGASWTVVERAGMTRR